MGRAVVEAAFLRLVGENARNSGCKGYLEDRRPNSQGDPYAIASRILQTIATVPTK